MIRPWLLIFVLPVMFGVFSCSFRESRKLETMLVENGDLKIRVTSYHRFIISGADYVFESSTPKGEWKEITTVYYDVADPINRESVHFVADQIAFVNMRWMYGVTTDNGGTWSVWDSQDHKYLNDAVEWGIIQSVAVNVDGTGEMKLRVLPSRDACQTLLTQDFGRTWVNGRQIDECPS